MRRAHESGVKVSLDAADPFVVVALQHLRWEVMEQVCDVVFLNADEARQLTEQEPEIAINTIAERAGVETVVVKLGSKGSLVRHQGETVHVGIHKVAAIDTTGAGDAYAGGFLYALTQGWSPKRCGAVGAAVAALTVAQIGAVVRDRDKLAAALSAADELAQR
jgi:sugar/nucleoside kinase (ribokinase family)